MHTGSSTYGWCSFQIHLGSMSIERVSEQKYQRKPLFNISVFQYATHSQIDFDIKFKVINFQMISSLRRLCAAVGLRQHWTRASRSELFRKIHKTQILILTLIQKFTPSKYFLIASLSFRSGPVLNVLNLSGD